jgi:cytoskeleton protein RodZ
MNEVADAPAAQAPSAGSQLKRAREAAGLHVAALAVSLKVPVGKLEALEDDRYDLLPDAVFARALASSVCRALKIDPTPVLERLPRSATPRLSQAREGLNAPFRVPGEGTRSGWMAHLTRPVAMAVGALLLGALALMLLPSIGEFAPAPEPVLPPGAPVTISVAPAEPRSADPASAPAAVPGPRAADAMPAGPTAPPDAAAAPTADTARPAPADARTVEAPTVPAAAASTPAAAPAASTGLVLFRTRGPSWVEVVDARGQTVLRRLMEGGEAASATGPLPLTVTVGSVGSTEVQVRGRPFDLGPVSRDNVARFEVR